MIQRLLLRGRGRSVPFYHIYVGKVVNKISDDHRVLSVSKRFREQKGQLNPRGLVEVGLFNLFREI